MWKPYKDFIALHYTYIITLGLLSFIIIYPYGNLKAVDAYFFGASGSTESGLNTVDVKALNTYQQLYIYFIPILANLGFVNILIVVVRLYWFEKRLRHAAPTLLRHQGYKGPGDWRDMEAACSENRRDEVAAAKSERSISLKETRSEIPLSNTEQDNQNPEKIQSPRGHELDDAHNSATSHKNQGATPSISFASGVGKNDRKTKALYIPPPWERDRGHPILEIDDDDDESDLELDKAQATQAQGARAGSSRQRIRKLSSNTFPPLERVASSMRAIGTSPSTGQASQLRDKSLSKNLDLPGLSSHATVGRNSQFHNLTSEDRDLLGGIEYRSLKLLLKIATAYFFGLHVFGAICLVGWIQHADPKYRQYLEECGQGNVWWAFYSAQTMVDNLGFTLTPDSMVSFRDATFPMILMSFLAFAGNTCYPCMLRLVVWIMFKLCPKQSSSKEPLNFLLKHPRRCYTLLFPSRPTWALFGILFLLNFVDIILILVLDLHNPAVTSLPPGPRVLAAIFQAASSRHTGTSTFSLANVNPGVQFSLLVMMYIAVFPIAISVRASNTYEESTLGQQYPSEANLDERNGRSYIMTHIRNQLSFDLWYVFLGVFCICIAEADRIMDTSDPAFAVFPILFEVVSAYGNVGLSLGYPTVNTSLSGKFTTFSKIVICAMMIRGRHRMLPYRLDRAIQLPNERLSMDDEEQKMLYGQETSEPEVKNHHNS